MNNYLLIAILFGGFISLWGNDAVKAQNCPSGSCTSNLECFSGTCLTDGCCSPLQENRKKRD